MTSIAGDNAPSNRFPAIGRATAWIVAGVAFVAVAARVDVPMKPVPMSLQTYAVLVIAGLAGWRLGVATVVAYLAAAAAGLPVLAGGASGLERVTGPTAGYLVGFAVAATFVGCRADRRRARGVLRLSAVMLAAHAIILGLGASWLATTMPWRDAYDRGVAPFLIGAAVKSVLAAVTVLVIQRLRSRVPDSHG